MEQIIQWVVNTVGQWGYAGIVIMMFLESSCFPFPSEVVMIPAGYLSSPNYIHSEGYVAGHEMNIWVAIAMGIIGSWLGALFNYYLALLLGRPLLLKWGKYLFISEENFEKAERFQTARRDRYLHRAPDSSCAAVCVAAGGSRADEHGALSLLYWTRCRALGFNLGLDRLHRWSE